MEKNDFNLNIPRYVDTFEPEAKVDMEKVQEDIVRIEVELQKTQSEMNHYLKGLGYNLSSGKK